MAHRLKVGIRPNSGSCNDLLPHHTTRSGVSCRQRPLIASKSAQATCTVSPSGTQRRWCPRPRGQGLSAAP